MEAFKVLNNINVNDHTERKNGLTYLAWAWAWGELKKLYPESFYTVYENRDGLFYHTDGKTCWVKTGVTLVDGEKKLEHIEYLPVMDMRNKSIPAANVTSFDVNKAIQRSMTKAVARHGLGLYIYAGEDLPEDEAAEQGAKPQQYVQANTTPPEGFSKARAAEVTVTKAFDPVTAVKELARKLKLTNSEFAACRASLIEMHLVPDLASKDMTEGDVRQLAEAFDKVYGEAS